MTETNKYQPENAEVKGPASSRLRRSLSLLPLRQTAKKPHRVNKLTHKYIYLAIKQIYTQAEGGKLSHTQPAAVDPSETYVTHTGTFFTH